MSSITLDTRLNNGSMEYSVHGVPTYFDHYDPDAGTFKLYEVGQIPGKHDAIAELINHEALGFIALAHAIERHTTGRSFIAKLEF